MGIKLAYIAKRFHDYSSYNGHPICRSNQPFVADYSVR